jgi:FAD/FMN-containing dehydrogenase
MATGYNLTRFLVASKGTLAIIAELTLKLKGISKRQAA